MSLLDLSAGERRIWSVAQAAFQQQTIASRSKPLQLLLTL